MCGLAGFLDPSNRLSSKELRGKALRMTKTLEHRGPDDQGTWVDPPAGIALGSRRLAIIDLSPAGHQPMQSASGRFVIAYNGEVYNASDIARSLERSSKAPSWRGYSDTEIILAAVEAWGLEGALEKFVGMFAFALWDTETRRLYLVRDRLGIKPLYFGRVNGTVVFGSELRAVAAYDGFQADIDRRWLDCYLRGTPTQSTRTIYTDVRSVPPGTYLRFESGGRKHKECVYWSAIEQAELGRLERFPGSEAEAVQALDMLLRDATRIRMVSDVPMGVLLSGGIDSAVVLALLQAQSGQTIRSFSIGFPDAELDEASDARTVATHIGSNHTELYVNPKDVVELIPSLPQLSDQPLSDPSFVSNYFAYRLAGQHVTVALAGDGGDEVFGGYHRHRWLPRISRTLGWMPVGLREQGSRALTAFSPATWDRMFGLFLPVIPSRLQERTPGAKLQRLARWMVYDSPEEMYGVLTTRWDRSDQLVVGHGWPETSPASGLELLDGRVGLLERMLAHELVTYLPNMQLTKVDRASMAVSVEARVPLLDHRVVEFALRMPPTLKIRGDTGKFLLRQVLYRYVPKELFQRPKMGFHLPLNTWLRGPLRDWAEDLLQPRRIREEGLLHIEPIRTKWEEHISGRRDRIDHLWPVLMLRSWLEDQ